MGATSSTVSIMGSQPCTILQFSAKFVYFDEGRNVTNSCIYYVLYNGTYTDSTMRPLGQATECTKLIFDLLKILATSYFQLALVLSPIKIGC